MKSTNFNNRSRVLLAVAFVFFGVGLNGCTGTSGRPPAQPPIKLDALRSAVEGIKKSDTGLASQLLEMTASVENSLNTGDKDGATKSLRSLANKVFTTSQETVRLELLLSTMDAVVKTQDQFDIPSGTTIHPGYYCRRTGPNKGACTQRNPTDICYAIDTIPDGCLGTP